eukprot:8348253-Pyramimonas_sp.AAC.1
MRLPPRGTIAGRGGRPPVPRTAAAQERPGAQEDRHPRREHPLRSGATAQPAVGGAEGPHCAEPAAARR